jgi:AAA domain
MRIAVSGTHRTGKSMLVADLGELLPGHVAVPEPYGILEEEGYRFAGTPSVEDYERQLEKSLDLFAEHRGDAIFERCPIDFVACLMTVPDADAFDPEDFLDRVRPAVETLTLVVLLPAEERNVLPDSEDRRHRLRVDEKLREILLDGWFGLDLEVLEVSGSRRQRVDQVLAWIRERHEKGRNAARA